MDHDDLVRRSRERLGAMGRVTEWSNGSYVRYEIHTHPYRKVLVCVEGSIIFHLGSGDHHLAPGDELDLPPRTPHGATVGAQGVSCIEVAVV